MATMRSEDCSVAGNVYHDSWTTAGSWNSHILFANLLDTPPPLTQNPYDGVFEPLFEDTDSLPIDTSMAGLTSSNDPPCSSTHLFPDLEVSSCAEAVAEYLPQKRLKSVTGADGACWTSPLCLRNCLPTDELPCPNECSDAPFLANMGPAANAPANVWELAPPDCGVSGRPNAKRMSSTSGEESAEEARPAGGKPRSTRTPHNQVERKYRENLNSQIQKLRALLPMTGQQAAHPCAADADAEDLGAAPKPLSKAVVIARAVEYLQHVEAQRRQQEQAIAILHGRIGALQRLIRCDDCSLMKFVVDMKLDGATNIAV